MIFYKILTIALCSIQLLLIIAFSFKSKNVTKTLLLNAAVGVLCLILVNLTSGFTNVRIPINWYSVSTSLLFGFPGVTGILMFNLLL